MKNKDVSNPRKIKKIKREKILNNKVLSNEILYSFMLHLIKLVKQTLHHYYVYLDLQ